MCIQYYYLGTSETSQSRGYGGRRLVLPPTPTPPAGRPHGVLLSYMSKLLLAQQLIKHVMKIDSQCVLMVITFTKTTLISYSSYHLKEKHHYPYTTQLTLLHLKRKPRYGMFFKFISELFELY